MMLTASKLFLLLSLPLGYSKISPVRSVEETSLKNLQHGIDRICNTTSLNEVFLINNEDALRGSPFISKFVFQRPVTLRDMHYLGSIVSETCFVAFITTSTFSEVLRDHMEKFGEVFIAVVSNDVLDNVKKYAARRYKCMMYYFHYDPVTYIGSWTIEHESKLTYTLDQVFNGWNLWGQKLIYFNADTDRSTPFDTELGSTIAERHNGSFKEADGVMECYNYMYSQRYAISMGSFAILPEMVQMCFVVPRSTPKSLFSILLDPFDLYSWGAYGLAIVVVSFLLSLFGESYKRYNVVLISLELVMNALNGPTHQFEGRFEVRMIGLYMLMNVVLISCYQSLVISLMSSARYDVELNTIEQVNESCYFQRDLFREFVGLRFKNTFRTFDLYGTYEQMWTNKVCQLITCSDLSIGHMRFETQSEAFDDEDDPDFDRYYRYSKVRLRTAVGMYIIFNFSPMRTFIKRYVSAYNEGHLHHWALLKMAKMSPVRQDMNENFVIVAMSAEDLLLVWIIFLIGCAVSSLVFASELMVVYIPKAWRFIRSNTCRKLATCLRSVKNKIRWDK